MLFTLVFLFYNLSIYQMAGGLLQLATSQKEYETRNKEINLRIVPIVETDKMALPLYFAGCIGFEMEHGALNYFIKNENYKDDINKWKYINYIC